MWVVFISVKLLWQLVSRWFSLFVFVMRVVRCKTFAARSKVADVERSSTSGRASTGFGGSVSTVVGTEKWYEGVREGMCIVGCLENKCNRFIVICRCC